MHTERPKWNGQPPNGNGLSYGIYPYNDWYPLRGASAGVGLPKGLDRYMLAGCAHGMCKWCNSLVVRLCVLYLAGMHVSGLTANKK